MYRKKITEKYQKHAHFKNQTKLKTTSGLNNKDGPLATDFQLSFGLLSCIANETVKFIDHAD